MIPESHLARRDTSIGLSSTETLHQIELEVKNGGGWDAKKYLKKEIERWDYNRRWRSELGPFVVDLAQTSYLSAERFLEHVRDPLRENPDFDIKAYGNTSMLIYGKLGRNVGDYYTRSYPYVVGAGIDPEKFPNFKGLSPQAFHDFIQKCGIDGGREFARWMADASIAVLSAGGNLEEFEAVALKIREKGGAKLIKPLAQNAGEITLARKQEVFFQDFEELTLNAIDTLGKDATYWLLRALPTLVAKHKVNPFDFVHDMEEIAAKYGQITVRQYLGGLCKNLKTLGDVKEEEAQERLDTAHNAYQELIDACGKTASSFFAFRGLDLSSVAALQINQKSIALLKRRVKPKVFHATAWFGSKIETLELTALLGLVATYAEKHGAEQTVKELQYAAGAIRNGGFVAGFPILHSTKYNHYGETGFDEETRGEWEYEDISGIENEIDLKEGQQYRLL